ncbi:MAG: hypothetical protein JM58_07250 [Peptococcaceae bacterium BICA1-8]|nr:MAG: hypothetical protein JM58_07250 [Peptococcaceae bacterium BICA1-8]
MDGFKRRKGEKEDRIYQAALELFSMYGVQKVKITEIAAKGQVSPVTIYNYYGCKHGLLRTVIIRFMNDKYSEYEEILNTEVPFPKKIDKIIFDKQQTARILHEDFLRYIMSKDPEIQKFIEKFYLEKSLPMLMEIIKQGRDEDYVSQDISIDALLLYITLFKEVINRPELILNENKTVQMELSSLFFYGLMGKGNKC